MHGAGTGGVEKSLEILCKYLDKERFEAIVAVPKDGPLKSYLDGIKVKTVVTPLEWWTPIQFFFGERHYYSFLSGLRNRVHNLVRIINENGIDLVHSSTLTVADGAIAAKLAGRPHIWHIHGCFKGISVDSFGTYIPIEVLYTVVSSLSAKIVAVSQTVKDLLSRYMPLHKTEVIYNGIDLSRFDGRKRLSGCLHSEFPCLHDKLLAALVGRVAKVKGIEDYVEAAIKVLKRKDDIAFLIVGPTEDQILEERIRDRINSLHLTDKIILAGYRQDIPALLREVDLMVCSSESEGFPYSILEAMASRTAVVATKCGGAEEAVVHGETGYLVGVNKPHELAEAILSATQDRERLRLMGEKGRQKAEQLFDARLYARDFEKLYHSIKQEDFHQHPETHMWVELLFDFASNFGSLGVRMIEHDHEIRDLRNFEALFKNNFFYKSLKKIYLSVKKE